MFTTFKQTIFFVEHLSFSLQLLNICDDKIATRRSVTTKSTKGGKHLGFETEFPSRGEDLHEDFAGVCVCVGGV